MIRSIPGIRCTIIIDANFMGQQDQELIFNRYGRIVERIFRNENTAQREQALKILGWIVCAKRSLKWNEIQSALSIRMEQQTVDFEKRQLVLDMQQLCGSLVLRLPGDRIELVHSTAKMFVNYRVHPSAVLGADHALTRRYLVQDHYVRMATEEGKLAALCLGYLTFESFFLAASRSLDEIIPNVKAGLFAFQDYAVLHWVDHLESFVKIAEPEDLGDLDLLGPISEDFLALYSPEDQPEDGESYSLETKCQQVEDSESFDTIKVLIKHAKQSRDQNEDIAALGKLGSAISQIRLAMETLLRSGIAGTTSKQHLHTYYGPHGFKCPRHLCFYFHEGFLDLKRRDLHVSRHERPFCCSYVGCSRVQTGFSTDKELRTHLRKSHPSPESLSWKFPKQKKPELTSSLRFPCERCPKTFTRAHSLKCHMQIHNNERRYSCIKCGQSFRRRTDQRWHERLCT